MAKNILKMNRGDTFSFNVVIEDPSTTNAVYKLKESDILYFAIMPPHSKFEDAEKNGGILRYFIAEDQSNAGSFEILLTPKDTKDLFPGVYYYSLKLQKLSIEDYEDASYLKNNFENFIGNFSLGEIKTVVPRAKFIINE